MSAQIDLEKGLDQGRVIDISQDSANDSNLRFAETITRTSTPTLRGSPSSPNLSQGTSTPRSSHSAPSISSKKEELSAFDLAPQADTEPVKEIELPETHTSELALRVRHSYASSYRKIFTFIFTANLAVLVALVAVANGVPDMRSVGDAASANLMVCILFRQEEFVNMVYELFVCVPHSTPVWFRKRLAKVFHYGGCHSGAGTAAVAWYLLYTALSTVEFVQDPQTDVLVNMITSWILVSMFVIILVSAHPSLRRKFHDYFEAFHRFAGWTALITFWIHNIFSSLVTARQWDSTLGYVLVRSPNFWFICVSTSCSILSWSRLRHHTVYPEKLSDHATRLHFKYRKMQPFYGVKLSDKPLTEWHAFATIPDTDPATGKINGFSVVVSNAGDWTKKQISKPNERKLWIRGAPLHGLLYTSKLFKRIVLVATGSGIGPCLSLMADDSTPRRILWSTRAPEKTYGQGVINAVTKADPNAIIWNTSTRGYPKIVLETWKLVKEFDAEAVFVISNPKVTDLVVFGMQSRGIPAYGAIFDS